MIRRLPVYHRKGVDILKGISEVGMASSREPNVRTPLSRKELMALRAEMKQQQISKLRETYRTMWEMSKMFGDAPRRPWVIQTLVQAWQEIYQRYPKGR
jgi:hypothetical protein